MQLDGLVTVTSRAETMTGQNRITLQVSHLVEIIVCAVSLILYMYKSYNSKTNILGVKYFHLAHANFLNSGLHNRQISLRIR